MNQIRDNPNKLGILICDKCGLGKKMCKCEYTNFHYQHLKLIKWRDEWGSFT